MHYSYYMTNTDTGQCRCDALTNLNVPDGASGVDARCAQPLWICLIPIKGCQRRTELAVLVLHQHFSVRQRHFFTQYICDSLDTMIFIRPMTAKAVICAYQHR